MRVSNLRGFAGSIGGGVAQVVVLLALTPYLAERLGPWQFVAVCALTALGSLLSLLECGIAPATAAAAGRALASGGAPRLLALIGESRAVVRRRAAFAILAGVVLGTSLMFGFARLGATITIVSVLFVALSVGLTVATAGYVGLFLGLGRGHELGAAAALGAAARALFVVLAVERAATVDAVMAGYALSALLLLLLCRRAVADLPIPAVAEPIGLAALVRARAKQSVVTTSSTLLGGHADLLVVLFCLGVEPAVAYALGQVLAVTVRILGAAFEPLSIPFSVSTGDASPVETYVRPVRARLVFVGLWIAPLAPAMPALARVWTPWLDAHWLATSGVVAAVLTVSYGLAGVGIRALAVLREQDRGATLNAIGSLEIALLAGSTGLALFVRGDAIGVALAFLGTRLVISVFLLPLLAGRAVGVPALELIRAAYLPFVAIAGVTVAATMMLTTVLADAARFFWVPIVVGGVLYGALAWRFGLDAGERGRVRARFIAFGQAPTTEP